MSADLELPRVPTLGYCSTSAASSQVPWRSFWGLAWQLCGRRLRLQERPERYAERDDSAAAAAGRSTLNGALGSEACA